MSKIKVTYLDELRTTCSQDNGITILTDGPKEFQGKGEYFSPTDLIAVSLASCILTVMGMAARRAKVDLGGATATVEKEMATTGSRRISKIAVEIHCEAKLDEETKAKLEKAAYTCPVHSSLHPEIEQKITFSWG
jgi:putative redox protein